MSDKHDLVIAHLGQVILELAEKATNPLLLLLNGKNNFSFDTKYPVDLLTFGNRFWKAYYHIHEKNSPFDDEHGHFHIFTLDKENNSWTHVIALSMDQYGQPVQWFSVNHWAVSGEWLDADQMCNLVDKNLQDAEENGILEKWLYSMLLFYKEKIKQLLLQRDRSLMKNQGGNVKEDREIYVLSSAPVSVISDLERAMNTTNDNS